MKTKSKNSRRIAFRLASSVAVGAALTMPALAQNSDHETGTIKLVIGQETPLAKKCFENARDQFDSYDALTACDRSLDEEKLTKRRRASVHANRGVILFNLGNYREAAADFTKSLNLGIHVRAKLHTNRGLSYEALGQDAKAKRDYDAALAINPNYSMAKKRREELDKPRYDRSNVIRRITVETPVPPGVGI